MTKIRVADYIVRRLEELGTSHAFMLSGGGMMHLQDALARSKTMHYVCCHHEQSCAYAAEAYARQLPGLGVAFATGGPGGANLVTGIVQAWVDSSPVVFLVGQAKRSETIRGTGLMGLRQYGTFEVDMISIVQSITKYSAFVDDPAMIGVHLDRALGQALAGRPGPTLLEVPLDVQGALIDPATLAREAAPATPVTVPDAEVRQVIEWLQRARRPLILAGHGVRVSGAAELFRSLCARLNIPVATTQLATDLLPYDHPLFVGHPGVKGDRAGGFAVQSADTLLVIGCSLHSMTTGYELPLFAPTAMKIQVDPDPLILRREHVGVTHQLQAPVDAFLRALDAAAPSVSFPESPWHAHCRQLKSTLSVFDEPHPTTAGALNYYDVIAALNAHLQGGETIVADAGSAYYIVGQAIRPKARTRVILAGGLAQMGYTTGAAIGAAFAAPDRTIIGVTGDGSFQMNVHDLAVMHHHRLNIKLVVVNNGGYVCIRNTQHAYFGGLLSGVDEQTGVSFPDLEQLASAYGVPYARACSNAELEAALTGALSTRGPLLLEAKVVREQEILPSVQSQRRPDGTMASKPLHEMYPFLPDERTAELLMRD